MLQLRPAVLYTSPGMPPKSPVPGTTWEFAYTFQSCDWITPLPGPGKILLGTSPRPLRGPPGVYCPR